MINMKSLLGPYDEVSAEQITERLLESAGLYVALEQLARGDINWLTFNQIIEMEMDDAHTAIVDGKKEEAELAASEVQAYE